MLPLFDSPPNPVTTGYAVTDVMNCPSTSASRKTPLHRCPGCVSPAGGNGNDVVGNRSRGGNSSGFQPDQSDWNGFPFVGSACIGGSSVSPAPGEGDRNDKSFNCWLISCSTCLSELSSSAPDSLSPSGVPGQVGDSCGCIFSG